MQNFSCMRIYAVRIGEIARKILSQHADCDRHSRSLAIEYPERCLKCGKKLLLVVEHEIESSGLMSMALPACLWNYRDYYNGLKNITDSEELQE